MITNASILTEFQGLEKSDNDRVTRSQPKNHDVDSSSMDLVPLKTKCKLPCTYDQPDSKKIKMYAQQPLKVTEPDEMQVAVLEFKINGVVW